VLGQLWMLSAVEKAVPVWPRVVVAAAVAAKSLENHCRWLEVVVAEVGCAGRSSSAAPRVGSRQ
jgi:hypothetical protein